MKAALVLLLLSGPTLACDWVVTEKFDPMTDKRACTITSPSVRLGVGVTNGVVTFVSGTPYWRDHLTVRVDDQPAILLGERGRSTDAFKDDARSVLGQIRAGQRIRISYSGVDGTVNGDGAICTLPSLIDNCL